MKNKNGSAYVYVLVFLLLAAMFLNLGLNIVNVNSEKKYGENNNLYYVAELASNLFLDKLNEILELSLKEAAKSEESEEKIFDANVKKLLPLQKIDLQITNADEKYKIEIDFEKKSCADFYANISASNTFNNKYKLDCEFKREADKFIIASCKLVCD